MQINKDEIQRPTLITPFLSEELTPDNEFLTYVDTNNDCKSVTQTTNYIKTDSNSLIHRTADDEFFCKQCTVFPQVHDKSIFFHDVNNDYKIVFKVHLVDTQIFEELHSVKDFHILKPHSHNYM